MELDISTLMMILFILLLVASIWKIWAFIPNKALDDDDRTQEAQEDLHRIMRKILKENKNDITNTELFVAMREDESFDTKRFWRFNQNRLNLLRSAYKRT